MKNWTENWLVVAISSDSCTAMFQKLASNANALLKKEKMPFGEESNG